MATPNDYSNRLEGATLDLVTTVHPDYRRNISNWRFMRDSYIGGQDYQDGMYLTRYQFESEEEYRNRILQTPIDNHCKSVVHVYNSFIFQNPVKREFGTMGADPGLKPFLQDADLEGRSLDAVMREVNIWSSVYGHVWVIVDKPETQTRTRAEELQQGIRPYVSIVTPENVLDWQYVRQSNGLYTLSYLKIMENDDLTYRRANNTIFTREYYPDRIELRKYDRADKDQGTLIETIVNPIGVIPALCVYSSRSGTRGIGISDINDVAHMQRAIYDELSEIEQLIRINNHPSLVSTVDVQAAAGAGARIIMPENQDSGLKPYLLQPSSSNLDGIMSSIARKVEAIDRMANMGNARGSTARTMSGVAMDTEFRQLNVKLSEKADNLEYAEEQLWRFWAQFQGRVWDGEIHYPNTFNIRDRITEMDLAKKSMEVDPENPWVIRAIRETIAESLTDKQYLQELIENWRPGMEEPAPVTIAGRQYPDGEPIPANLPEAYQAAEGEAEQCMNCEYYKRGRCLKFNKAPVRADWVCARWEPIEITSNPNQ